MTKAQLNAIVVETTGRSDKTSLIDTALVFGGRQIQQARLWSNAFTVADLTLLNDTFTVTKPTDLDKLYAIGVFPTGSTIARYRIRVVDSNTFHTIFPRDDEPDVSGDPLMCYESPTSLVFGPRANRDFTIKVYYYKKHTLMATADATPLLEAFDEILIAFASAYVFRAIEMFDSAAQWEAVFARRLQQLSIDDNDRPAVDFTHNFMLLSPSYSSNPQMDPFAADNSGIRTGGY